VPLSCDQRALAIGENLPKWIKIGTDCADNHCMVRSCRSARLRRFGTATRSGVAVGLAALAVASCGGRSDPPSASTNSPASTITLPPASKVGTGLSFTTPTNQIATCDDAFGSVAEVTAGVHAPPIALIHAVYHEDGTQGVFLACQYAPPGSSNQPDDVFNLEVSSVLLANPSQDSDSATVWTGSGWVFFLEEGFKIPVTSSLIHWLTAVADRVRP
jgi:hypothetical protein